MNLYGLNWRSTWPLMNHPNNIPFRGPEAMCNQLVMLNLPKIEKKLKKIYVVKVLRLLEAKFQSFSFLYLNPILNGSSRWKNFFDPRCSSKDMTWVEGNFQELFSHWSMDLSQIGLQYHWGLGVSFPKWYDTWDISQICTFLCQFCTFLCQICTFFLSKNPRKIWCKTSLCWVRLGLQLPAGARAKVLYL